MSSDDFIIIPSREARLSDNEKPSWLDALSIPDRKMAEKFIALAGNDASLYRMAKAISASGPRREGRPDDPKLALMKRAAELYAIRDGIKLGSAASVAVREVFEKKQHKTQQTQLRRKLEKDPQFLKSVAKVLADQDIKIGSNFPNLQRAQEKARRLNMRMKTLEEKLSAELVSRSFRNVSAGYCAAVQRFEQQKKEWGARRPYSLFAEAFGHIIPGSMPVTIANHLYHLVEEIVRDMVADLYPESGAPER